MKNARNQIISALSTLVVLFGLLSLASCKGSGTVNNNANNGEHENSFTEENNNSENTISEHVDDSNDPVTPSTISITVNEGETANGFTWEHNYSEITITGYIGDSNHPVMPSVINDKPVTTIKSNAFDNFVPLESMTLSKNLKTFDNDNKKDKQVFEGCENLKVIKFPGTVGEWCAINFKNNSFISFNGISFYIEGELLIDLKIPDNVTSIGSNVFLGCTSLTSVTIPDSVTSIGSNAFRGCTSLISVTIPDSVTSIGGSAFEFCYKLIEVCNRSSLSIVAGSDSNGNVAYYAKHVFSSGSSYLHVTNDGYIFYENGEEVYLVAYTGNETQLTLPNKYNGKNYGINQGAFCNRSNLTSVMIPIGVTSIGVSAFDDCTSLTSVTIPDSVTEIDDYAFFACTSLTSVTIPDRVTSIGKQVFSYCTNLTSVTIPDSVTSIDEWAFTGCKSLTTVYYTGTAEQWEEISISLGNNSLTNAAIVYNYAG